MSVSKKSDTPGVVYTNRQGTAFRLAITVAQWHARPDDLADEYAYWFNPVADGLGMDAWALIDGVDALEGDTFELTFATTPVTLTVTGDQVIYVKPAHHARCLPWTDRI